jgi:hypothetical protein
MADESLARGMDNLYGDERVKGLLLDLQRHWQHDYKLSQERIMVALTEKVILLFVWLFN